MKIEIDLDKLRMDMQLLKDLQEMDNTITMTVRQWGESLEFYSPGGPDGIEELAVEQMKHTIENRIRTFMRYAPDVSDIKPNEVRVFKERGHAYRVVGSFYYCSQIVDYWEGEKTRAVSNAKRSEHYNTLYHLQESYQEQADYNGGECWQKEAAADLARRLEELE